MTIEHLNLMERRADQVRWLGEAIGTPEAVHRSLVSAVRRRLTEAHARIFARPATVATGWAWEAEGAKVKAFAELAPADRQALTLALGSILSDIRRVAEHGNAPEIERCAALLPEVPDLGCLFAVDGAPVLAAWGFVNADAQRPPGLLARFDDGVPAMPIGRTAVRPWLVTAAVLALLALTAGLTLPAVATFLVPAPARCRIDPADLARLDQSSLAGSDKAALEAELARLQGELGRRQLACTIPQQAPRQPPDPTPPDPPPPPRADLPRDRWNRGDLAMLQGCWQNTTDIRTKEYQTGKVHPVRNWQMCFGESGQGRQTIVWTDGIRCEGPLRASFESERMVISEPTRCAGRGRALYIGRSVCRHLNENEAECVRTETDGPLRGSTSTGRFRR